MRKPRITPAFRFSASTRNLFAAVMLLWALCGGCFAQQLQTPPAPNQPPPPPSPSQPPSPNGATSDVPGAGVTLEPQPPAAPPQQQEAPQRPITKAEARELFRSVDEILRFAGSDTGLPIRHSVKRKLITSESVQKYVDKRIKEDKDTQKLQRSEAILKKFGLLPPNYDLHTEFLRLLGEQVAAYYDARTKTVNLLDWVPPDQQKPVLAHELTHALQDQAVDLEQWGLAGAKDDRPLPDNEEEVAEEAQAAREAVTEGQAMVVFLDYALAPTGKTVATAPEMVDAMRAGMGDSADAPVFSRAPMFLKESLLMPYTFGIDFVRYVLVHQGKEAAFLGMLQKPPVDTRQIMQPETYVANEVVPPLKVPELDKLVGPDYERYDFGEMGEFDVYLLTRQYAPSQDPKDIYPHWRGGYYLAVHRKGAPNNDVALLYLSRWDSPEAAETFARLYYDYLPKRYPQWGPNHTMEHAGHPRFRYQLRQGPKSDRVYVSQNGNDVLAVESFDEATAQRIMSTLLPAY